MQFLLERLAYQNKKGQPDTFDMKSAVASQIQRIVSARMVDFNGVASLLDFGMPNVVELSTCSKVQLERYAARLKRSIVRYEPRLVDPVVSIEPTGDPLMPFRLVVTGCLITGHEPQQFHFKLPLH